MNLSQAHQNVTLQYLIDKYSIEGQDKQELNTCLGNRNTDGCLDLVSKKQRASFAKDLEIYYRVQEQKLKSLEITKDEPTKEEFFISLFKKYQVDEEDLQDMKQGINEANFELFVSCAKKKFRDSMRKDIVEYFEKLKCHKKPEVEEKELSQAQLNVELNLLFKQFEVQEEEFQGCLKSLKQNNIDECVDVVKKKKRVQFKKKIEIILKKYEKVLQIQYHHAAQKIKQAQQKYYQITIKVGQIMKDVKITRGVQQLSEVLLNKFDIQTINQYTISTGSGELVQSLEELFKQDKRQMLLKFTKKICLEYEFMSKPFLLWISQTADQKDIRYQVQKRLLSEGVIKDQQVCISFLNDNAEEKKMTILKDFIKQQGKVPRIIVGTLIRVLVFYQQQEKQYRLKSTNTVHDLKIEIQKELIPIQSQSLQIEKDNGRVYIEQNQQDYTLDKYTNTNILQLTLTNHHTVEFYGFHQNVQQTYDKFSQFTIERDEQFVQIINLCDFTQKNEEKTFQSAFLRYLNSCIKKKFPFEVIIEKVKQLVIKNRFQNIWIPTQHDKPKTMNESFLLMYLLRNSQSRLKVQIMHLVKNLMPLPLFIKQFPNIFSKTQTLSLNKQIVWAIQPGITVCCIGLHTQNIGKEKGKTEFINNIFFTNFCSKNNKHQIVKKIPYIAVKIYDQLFPLNIIDVPFDCDENIKQQLMDNSDIIFVQSWKTQKQTALQIEKISKKKICISFLRDCKQSTKQFLKILNQTKFQPSKIIKIPNLSNIQANKGSVDIIRSKINLFILEQKKGTLQKSVNIFKFFNDKCFSELNSSLQKLDTKANNICQFAQYTDLITNQINTQKKRQKYEQLKKKTLHPAITDFLTFIEKNLIPLDILLMHFRQKLRSIQTQNVARYMIIYKIKQRLEKCLQKNPDNYHQQVKKAQQILRELRLSSEERRLTNKNPQQVGKIIDVVTSDFENNIKPKIFSIQLFWREINAFLKIQPEYKIGSKSLFQLTRALKSKEVMNNQPFEIIDGDCLQMPKNMMIKVFQNFAAEKCIVLTIIGPQSSGKSTLLNFLFGCDFSTSQGRCTRGVYGTYFKINDSKIKNFEGVFVIDTQGLFALTNQTDQKHQDRQNFDSKLVLFCLAVSDFVIINVRGNLDKNTQKILSLCNEKLEALDLNQDQRPQIVIVLNQNNTSKTQESENQFKKIRKTFNFTLSRSLSLAYSIKNFGKNQISLLGQNQILTKKVPFTQFHIQTTNLLCEIVEKMKKKKGVQSIMTKLDKFSQIWSTVLTFPNLSQMNSKEHRKLQSEIKAWKKQREQDINSQISNILMLYNSDKSDEGMATRNIEQLNSKYLLDFQKQYQKQALNQQLKALYQNEKKQITLKNDNNYLKLKYQIMKTNMQKQLNKEKFEGDGILRQYEKDIIKNQNSGLKQYKEEQKKQIFEKGFTSALQKISKTMKLHDKPQVELQRIKADYEYYIKSVKSQIQNFGLPKDQLNFQNTQINKIDSTQMRKKFLNKLLSHGFREPQSFMIYTERPYTNILIGSQSDAKLKYFNIKEYFKKQKEQKRYLISKGSLLSAFKEKQFKNKLKTILEEKKMKQKSRSILRQIFNSINQYLRQLNAIQISSFDQFEQLANQHTSSYLGKAINYITTWWSEPKLQINYINGKVKKEAEQIKLLWQKVQKFISFYEHDFYVSSGPSVNKYNYTHNQSSQSYYIYSGNHYNFENQHRSQYPKDQKHKRDKSRRKGDVEKQQKPTNQKKQKKAIQKMLKQKINWRQIQNKVSSKNSQEQEKTIIYEVSEQIKDILNQDLKLINLVMTKVDRNTMSHGIFHFGSLFNDVEVLQENNLLKDSQFFNQSANFRFFESSKIKQIINQSNQEKIGRMYGETLEIARYEYDILVPIQNYFKGYQQSNNREMKKRFQDRQFKQFIFKEIKQKKQSLNLLFEQINKIVDNAHKKWGRFENKAIGQVFTDVNQEIAQFNNDLNQISHQLHHVAVGYVHIYAIHLIWKLEIDNIFKKNNEPYQKKLANKKIQYQRFLMRTSNDLNKIIRNEVEQFFEKIKQSFQQYINDIKAQQQNQIFKKFNMAVKRQIIQRQVDIEIFTSNTNPQIILQYLQKPYEFISSKYEQNYTQYFQMLVKEIKKKKYNQQFCKKIQQCISQMKDILTKEQKITQQKGNPIDLFEMVTKSSQKIDYDEQAKNTLFQYFCDRLTGDNLDEERSCSDIKVKLKKNLIKNQPIKGFARQVIEGVKNKNLKITNIIKFLSLTTEEHLITQLTLRLGEICTFSEQEERQFKNKIRVVICKQKCPCCGKICGLQGMHPYHQCLYGHQMRALAGNHIQKNGKKQAYVVRCQMLKQNDLMVYNGIKYTWTQFKDYWRSKPTGGWIYDDLKEGLKQEDKKRCVNAWLQAGPLFCQKMGMEYVDYNDAENQLKQIGAMHIIFALDQSGSMYSDWEGLLKALKQIQLKISKYEGQGNQVYVSIINFQSSARIIHKRCKPLQFDALDIPFGSGGTCFQSAFKKTYDLASQFIHQEQIIFIFMTDGGDSYPSSSIQLLKTLMKNNPNKFTYSGIQFGCSTRVMELIAKQLDGRNIRAANFDELLKAYSSCLEIITYQQNQKNAKEP